MKMSNEAIIALASFALYFTVNVVGIVMWIDKRFREIKTDFDTKHLENIESLFAVRELVIRHDAILNPDFEKNYHPPPYHIRKQ